MNTVIYRLIGLAFWAFGAICALPVVGGTASSVANANGLFHLAVLAIGFGTLTFVGADLITALRAGGPDGR